MLILFLLLIILFNIGRAFFNTAKKYDKSKRIYTLLGVFIFVISGTLSFLLAYLILITKMHLVFNTNWLFYGAYTVGIVGAIIAHFFLEKYWEKEDNFDSNAEIEKIGKKSNIDD